MLFFSFNIYQFFWNLIFSKKNVRIPGFFSCIVTYIQKRVFTWAPFRLSVTERWTRFQGRETYAVSGSGFIPGGAVFVVITTAESHWYCRLRETTSPSFGFNNSNKDTELTCAGPVSSSSSCQGLGCYRALQVLQRCVLKKEVTVSALGVINTIKDRCWCCQNYVHDLDVHGEVGTGCRLWGLRPSRLWKDSSEGGWRNRCRGKVPVGDCAGEEGMTRTGTPTYMITSLASPSHLCGTYQASENTSQYHNTTPTPPLSQWQSQRV